MPWCRRFGFGTLYLTTMLIFQTLSKFCEQVKFYIVRRACLCSGEYIGVRLDMNISDR